MKGPAFVIDRAVSGITWMPRLRRTLCVTGAHWLVAPPMLYDCSGYRLATRMSITDVSMRERLSSVFDHLRRERDRDVPADQEGIG